MLLTPDPEPQRYRVEVESAVSKRRELDLQMKRLQEKNRCVHVVDASNQNPWIERGP